MVITALAHPHKKINIVNKSIFTNYCFIPYSLFLNGSKTISNINYIS